MDLPSNTVLSALNHKYQNFHGAPMNCLVWIGKHLDFLLTKKNFTLEVITETRDEIKVKTGLCLRFGLVRYSEGTFLSQVEQFPHLGICCSFWWSRHKALDYVVLQSMN